jgi:hypothetical protein
MDIFLEDFIDWLKARKPKHLLIMGAVVLVVVVTLGIVAVRFIAASMPSPVSEMTCKEFMTLDKTQRANVADELFTAKHETPNSLGSTNALLNIEYTCENRPERKVSDISV